MDARGLRLELRIPRPDVALGRMAAAVWGYLRRCPATFALVGALFAVDLLTRAIPSTAAVARQIGDGYPGLFHSPAWVVLTSWLRHSDHDHLMSNVWFLLQGGLILEPIIGSWPLTITFAVTAVGGTIADAIITSRPACGASSGCFGLAGAALAVLATDARPLRRILWVVATVHTFSCLLNSGEWIEVAHAAHVAGLVTGIALGMVWRRPTAFPDLTQKILVASAAGAVLAVLVVDPRWPLWWCVSDARSAEETDPDRAMRRYFQIGEIADPERPVEVGFIREAAAYIGIEWQFRSTSIEMLDRIPRENLDSEGLRLHAYIEACAPVQYHRAALANFRMSLVEAPDDPLTLMTFARFRATSPDSLAHDTFEARRMAWRAAYLNGFKTSTYIQTLAITHRSAGEMEVAVALMKLAIRLSPPSRQYEEYLAKLEEECEAAKTAPGTHS